MEDEIALNATQNEARQKLTGTLQGDAVANRFDAEIKRINELH